MVVRSLVLLAGAMLAVTAESQFAVGAPAQTSRLIAFQTDRDGNHEIYVMNEDGTGQTNLTKNAANDMVPKWSPNGRQIVFASNRDGSWGIYRINADGSGLRRLTTAAASEFAPSWSPNGKQIAFTGNSQGDWEIYVIDAAGKSQPKNISNSPELEDLNPDWSTDGRRIVFQGGLFGDEGFGLRIVDANGGKPRPLPRRAEDEVIPAWSPVEGNKIAYVRLLRGNYGIYATDTTGKARQRLIDLPRTEESDPSWAPDGKQIAFTFARTDREIYALRLGRSARNLTNRPDSNELHPAWQPVATRGRLVGDRIVTRVVRTRQRALACGSGTINGTSGDNNLCGSGGTDTINGLGGDDRMRGYGAGDTLRGDNVLDGSQGRDWFWGGLGDDVMWARDGQADCIVHGDGHVNGDSAQIDYGADPVMYVESYF